MTTKQFFSTLGLLSAGTGLLLAALHFLLPPVQEHWKFSIGVLALFVGICTGLYFAGLATLRSTNKYAFNSIITLSVFGKMVLSCLLLFAYRSVAKPENEWFAGIFFLVYSIFTVFEVVFMTRLAKM